MRRAFLCITDSVSGNSYDHRREWIQKRLVFLAGVFAVDVLVFVVMSNHFHVVMSNHFHVVVRNRPDVVQKWSALDVAKRWWRLFPRRHDENDGSRREATMADLAMVTTDEKRLAKLRTRLSSVS